VEEVDAGILEHDGSLERLSAAPHQMHAILLLLERPATGARWP